VLGLGLVGEALKNVNNTANRISFSGQISLQTDFKRLFNEHLVEQHANLKFYSRNTIESVVVPL